MNLSQLFKDAPSIEIESIMMDSRNALSNSIFFCIKGSINDGHLFVEQAIKNGAVVIIHSDDLSFYHENKTYIRVKDVHKSLISICTKFYGMPSEKLTVFGITGTNGKTSVATLIKDVLDHKEKCGYIGTLGIRYEAQDLVNGLTTPDVNILNHSLSEMVKRDIKSCALEVSSIGIDQGRVATVDFDYAIFTNFTHDHLDYHGTMENYFNCKKHFFSSLDESKYAIINVDDAVAGQIVNDCKAKIVTYGIDHQADYQAKNIELYADKTVFTLSLSSGGSYRVETNLVALFNVYNLLATISALHLYGMEMSEILEHLHQLNQIEGRMERINHGQLFNIVVDFAHTPDGIKKVMDYAKAITPKNARIISVFGSAGKRDVKKRVQFGELADQYCDMIILTEDDPRDESVSEIANQIAKGISNKNYIIVEDRYNAIYQAIELANSNDTILILGKGDEKFLYKEFGKEDYIGDDCAVIAILDKIRKEEEENEQVY
ncbi:MAG: UDP-N-acetylmuramoyl-L-alanyl-D-glutamate--2,6-diaminopimelate ligase [Erysipelotrichaceae bacterium]